MPSLVETAFVWLRRHLAWSNSRESWIERGAAVLLLVVAGCLYRFSGGIPRSYQVVLWCFLLAVTALVLRRGWLRLFGPVLFYDLICIARRGRYLLLRCAYALFLLLILWSVYANYNYDNRQGMDSRKMAEYAQSFFFAFVLVQFLVVNLLTPAYTASAIAEERERRTLEFLLATDLQNREIVLSKQLSRLCNLGMLVLAGLPILAFTQFLGGVDPDLVLACFAATGMTMTGLGSASILCSVYSSRPRNAIVLTYLGMVTYFAVSSLLAAMLAMYPSYGGAALTPGSNPWTVRDLADGLEVGNPVLVYLKLARSLFTRQQIADVLPDVMRDYAVFYGVVTLVCTVWSVLRLRVVALSHAAGAARKRSRFARRERKHPAVSNRPMVWKEIHAEPGLNLNVFGRIAMVLLLIASFAPLVAIVVYFWEDLWYRGDSWRWFQQGINIWVRIVGTLVALLSLLGVAVRASGAISGERDRQTFDSLLTSPLDSGDMLFAKWLGSMASVRWTWVWLGLIWTIGAVTGGVYFLAVPLLMLAWFVYASFLGVLGLWFSTVCRTTMRANVWTLLATIGFAGGHWLPWMTCCLPLRLMDNGSNPLFEHWAKFQSFGLTPPFALGWLAFRAEEFDSTWRPWEPWEFLGDVLGGLVVWGIGAALLWWFTSQHFRRVTNRQPSLPRRKAPPEHREEIATPEDPEEQPPQEGWVQFDPPSSTSGP